MKYKVNDSWLSYEAKGERMVGDARVQLADAIDLTAGQSWSDTGFTIAPLFDAVTFEAFMAETRNVLKRCWNVAGLYLPEEFELDQYHKLLKNRGDHMASVDKTRLLSVSKFPIGISKIERRISEICGTALRARNPFDGQSVFHFRVIRPMSTDNNPLHKDVWLEDYANCINLYIPVAGSDARSSLIIIPGSHRWLESRIERTVSGCEINGTRFNVPAVTDIRGDYTVERPDPALNEVLIFSPYLIHGGSVNLNDNKTRISIELRLWKA